MGITARVRVLLVVDSPACAAFIPMTLGLPPLTPPLADALFPVARVAILGDNPIAAKPVEFLVQLNDVVNIRIY